MLGRRSFLGGGLLALALACGLAPGAGAGQGADRIAATVNGENILADEFFTRLQFLRGQNFIVSLNPLQMRGETAGTLLLNALIDERLILQWAEKTKQMPADEEVQKEVARQKERAEVKAWLESGLVSSDLLERETRATLARFNIATTAAAVSEKDAEAWYKKNIARFGTPERWGVAVVRTLKPDLIPKIQADLKAGKPFEEVVKAYSDEPTTKARGGMMGVFSASDPAVPAPFVQALKTLKIGSVAGPVKVEASTGPNRPSVVTHWFLRLVSREPAALRPFTEVKESVTRAALLEAAGGMATADKKIAEFRKQSDIKIVLPGYQKLLTPPEKKP